MGFRNSKPDRIIDDRKFVKSGKKKVISEGILEQEGKFRAGVNNE
jgi:hypothetical protein